MLLFYWENFYLCTCTEGQRMQWAETWPLILIKSIKLLCFCKGQDPRHPEQTFPHGKLGVSNYIQLLGKFRSAVGVSEQPPVDEWCSAPCDLWSIFQQPLVCLWIGEILHRFVRGSHLLLLTHAFIYKLALRTSKVIFTLRLLLHETKLEC